MSPLTGQAKKDYQREYMRKRRATEKSDSSTEKVETKEKTK